MDEDCSELFTQIQTFSLKDAGLAALRRQATAHHAHSLRRTSHVTVDSGQVYRHSINRRFHPIRLPLNCLWWEEVMFNERCTEPSLDELFGDFAMRLLMRRDGVTESDIQALLCELRNARAGALGGTKRKPRVDRKARSASSDR
jgi:hypothetical protein